MLLLRIFISSIFVITFNLPAFAACRQALVLALDVSSSVDETEYRLQTEGLSAALSDPDLRALLLSQPSAPLSIAVFEWSGRNNHRMISGWRDLRSPEDLAAVIKNIRTNRPPSGTQRPTAIGHALGFASALLANRAQCWKHTIDISGDGKNNQGVAPETARNSPALAGTTINALAIGVDAPPLDQIAGNEIAELSSYFRKNVIHGPGAFVETAIGFENFQTAMKRKLLRELSIAVASNP